MTIATAITLGLVIYGILGYINAVIQDATELSARMSKQAHIYNK